MKNEAMPSSEQQAQPGSKVELKERRDYFQIGEEAQAKMEEALGIAGMSEEELEASLGKDPLIQKLLSAENPSKRLKAAQEMKIPMLSMLGKAAKLRQFMITNPEFKRLAELSEEMAQEEEAAKIKKQIDQAG
ncbi:hypothetical protein IT087_01715 [Candidatus Uhrbacteria bacterium]|nr:hypothetical protein [Candidatus Uhrbacteria bacterium]